ncbi:hypothetical protein GCM10027591_17780 [Zhihengliuella somnathii]
MSRATLILWLVALTLAGLVLGHGAAGDYFGLAVSVMLAAPYLAAVCALSALAAKPAVRRFLGIGVGAGFRDLRVVLIALMGSAAVIGAVASAGSATWPEFLGLAALSLVPAAIHSGLAAVAGYRARDQRHAEL